MAFHTALIYNIITSNRIKANIVIGQKLLSRQGHERFLKLHYCPTGLAFITYWIWD